MEPMEQLQVDSKQQPLRSNLRFGQSIYSVNPSSRDNVQKLIFEELPVGHREMND